MYFFLFTPGRVVHSKNDPVSDILSAGVSALPHGTSGNPHTACRRPHILKRATTVRERAPCAVVDDDLNMID